MRPFRVYILLEMFTRIICLHFSVFTFLMNVNKM